jgi:hypothetical protein
MSRVIVQTELTARVTSSLSGHFEPDDVAALAAEAKRAGAWTVFVEERGDGDGYDLVFRAPAGEQARR